MPDRGPTRHELRAALHVARLIDEHGNSVEAARMAYRHAITGRVHPLENLVVGERILLRSGLLTGGGDDLLPTAALMVLVALADDEALLALAAACGVDDLRSLAGLLPDDVGEDSQAIRDAYGAAGEVAVVLRCRDELADLGRSDLVEGVQRVSLVSDALGYDVAAPSIGGDLRLLEVKTQGAASADARFYLSRNEYEVGRARAGWALVCCRAPDGPDGPVEVVGWCRASALRDHLPEDRRGRWTEARVKLPLRVLMPGLPSAL